MASRTPGSRLAATILLVGAVALAGAIGPAAPARAEASRWTAPELDLKAAYLLSFARFVRQADAVAVPTTTPIAIAVVGDDELGRALERAVRGKHIDGRPIVVRSLHEPDSLRAFDLVFVGFGPSARVVRALERVRGAPVLTVGESDDFVEAGGIIGLYFEDRRLRFVINAAAADAAGLRISANLMSLAADVRGRRR